MIISLGRDTYHYVANDFRYVTAVKDAWTNLGGMRFYRMPIYLRLLLANAATPCSPLSTSTHLCTLHTHTRADQVDQTVTWCATFTQKYISRLCSITCFPHIFQGPDTTQTEAEASGLAMDQAVAPCFFSVAVDTLNDRQRAEVIGTSLEGWTPHNLRGCCGPNYPAFRLWGWGLIPVGTP